MLFSFIDNTVDLLIKLLAIEIIENCLERISIAPTSWTKEDSTYFINKVTQDLFPIQFLQESTI